MSTKELAYSMIDNLTEEQLNALIVILQGLQKEEPNEETKRKSLTKPKRVKISLVRLIQ